MEKYAHGRNVILGIIKAHYIVKTRPSNVKLGMSIQLQWGPLMRDQYKGAIIVN